MTPPLLLKPTSLVDVYVRVCYVSLWVWLQVLLGVDVAHLVELLTVSISFTRGEAIRRHLSKSGAVGTTQ